MVVPAIQLIVEVTVATNGCAIVPNRVITKEVTYEPGNPLFGTK